MKRKSFFTSCLGLALFGIIFISLAGCTSRDTDNDNTENANVVEEDNKDNAIVEKTSGDETPLNYTAIDLKNDFENLGSKLKDSKDSLKEYFTGKETDYIAGDNLIRVYEYENVSDLDSDLERISKDGLTVDGKKVYENKPYYYKKGNSLIVYEGSDPSYVNNFNKLYGDVIFP